MLRVVIIAGKVHGRTVSMMPLSLIAAMWLSEAFAICHKRYKNSDHFALSDITHTRAPAHKDFGNAKQYCNTYERMLLMLQILLTPILRLILDQPTLNMLPVHFQVAVGNIFGQLGHEFLGHAMPHNDKPVCNI